MCMLEPEIKVDIFETTHHPQYAVAINPPHSLAGVIQRAELVDLAQHTCGEVLPLIIALEKSSSGQSQSLAPIRGQKGIQTVAQCRLIYQRIWARPGLERYQNSVLVGLIMVHLNCFDVRWLAKQLRCDAHTLAHLFPHVKTLIDAMGDSRPEFSAYPYVEIVCSYMDHDSEVVRDAQKFSTTIETTAQLIPVGQLSPQSIAAVAVFMSALKHHCNRDIALYTEVGGSTALQFEGLCDWVWCTKATLSAEDHEWFGANRKDLWYQAVERNVSATVQLCEKSSARSDLAPQVREAAYRLPKTFFQRGLALCSAACVLAVTGEPCLDEQVLRENLWLSKWTEPQLQNYRRLIESYLRDSP